MSSGGINEMRTLIESGFEWLGKIPNNWKLTRIGNIYEERNEKVSDKEYQALSVTMNGIVPQLEYVVKSEIRDNRKKICINDFVINSRSDRRGAYGVSAYDGSCSLINIVLKPRNLEDIRYYNYVLQTKRFPDEFYRWGTGIVSDLWSTHWENMKKIVLPMPSSDERRKIVNFLDIKCREIDLLINKEQKLIEKFQEYREALITEKTLQGLDNTVDFRESGYQWLGKIPAHWKTVYSKKLFTLRRERALDGDEQLTSSQKYGIILQSEFMKLEGRQVVQVVKGEDILKHVEKGDFVISMRSFQGGLEYSTISGKISSAYVMLIPNKKLVCNDYYKWLFKSKRYIKALQSTSNLVRDGQALRFSNFAQVYLPHFSLTEQEKIGTYLNEKCSDIDLAIEESMKLINTLRNYKKSLIYEYVTGKKEVPEF